MGRRRFGGGGWGGRQRQMAEQSVGHRMQLLHINRLSSQLERVPSFGLELRRNSSFISGFIERCECGGFERKDKDEIVRSEFRWCRVSRLDGRVVSNF